MKNFEFTWYANERYGEPIQRKNIVGLSKPTGLIEYDAKAATELFTKGFGNLKKNTIVSIQELDAKGNPVGEPIVPDTDAIVPVIGS